MHCPERRLNWTHLVLQQPMWKLKVFLCVPSWQFAKSIGLGCFWCWHKIPEETVVLTLDLSLQLSVVGQSILTVKMVWLLQELRRDILDFKGLTRIKLAWMSTMVANLYRPAKEGLSFIQGYLPTNRQNPFHYTICFLPEFRCGKTVAIQHCEITIMWYIPLPRCHIFSHPEINLIEEQTMT